MLQPTPSSQLPPGGDPFEGSSYRWRRRLNDGGMGEVHVVEHIALGAEFLAKVLPAKYASHKQMVDRVRVEAQSLGRLEHPNVAQVKTYGVLRDGRPFIVMELLSGHTLESEMQIRGRLPVPEALRYGMQLASALAAAHAFGIVHRDIKPDNLFLHRDHDGSIVLKVLDFGVARIMPGFSDDAPLPLAVPTDTGIVVGTPRYVSPEAALGKRVDHRADIYGAGLVLHVMLTGRGPFDHVRDERRILAAHVQEVPAELSTHHVEGLSPELQAIVSHALAKNPDDRLGSAKELEARLARGLEQTTAAALQTTARIAPTDARAPERPVRSAPLPATAPAPPVPEPLASSEEPPPPAAPALISAGAGPETPAPMAGVATVRSPISIVAIFLGVAAIFGLAAAGAVIVLRRFAGGAW